jgi:hypothetical protein
MHFCPLFFGAEGSNQSQQAVGCADLRLHGRLATRLERASASGPRNAPAPIIELEDVAASGVELQARDMLLAAVAIGGA